MTRIQLYSLAAAVVAADQLSKAWVQRSFSPQESRELVPGLLALTYVQNTGGAFGIWGGLSTR